MTGKPRRRLLVLDTAYTYEMICERGLQDSLTCRDLEGFFDHVWSVHPFASMLNSPGWSPRLGAPVTHRVNERHSFIEGKVGRFGWLRLPALNFAVGQLLLLLQLRRLVRSNGISVIRVGDPLYVGLFGWLLAKISGVPLAIRVNGNNEQVRRNTGRPLYPRLFRKPGLERAIERFVLSRADLVAAINPDNLAYAIEAGARPDRATIFRIGNLIAEEHRADPAGRPADPALLAGLGVERGKFLLSIARLEAAKFPEDLVGVLADVRSRGLDVELLFVGDGTMRAELQALAGELGVAPHVRFAGNQPQAVLARLIPAASAVLSPLTGRSLSEAALGGAPIVAYDLDWQDELVESGVTGELVEFRDRRAFADATARLLSDPAYAKSMGAAVRERALEMLDPVRLNQHERAEYQRLFDRSAAP